MAKKKKGFTVPGTTGEPGGRGINDTRGPEDAVLGHFVDVISGENEGRYGTLMSVGEDGNCVVKARDDKSDSFQCDLSDLRPALAGRR